MRKINEKRKSQALALRWMSLLLMCVLSLGPTSALRASVRHDQTTSNSEIPPTETPPTIAGARDAQEEKCVDTAGFAVMIGKTEVDCSSLSHFNCLAMVHTGAITNKQLTTILTNCPVSCKACGEKIYTRADLETLDNGELVDNEVWTDEVETDLFTLPSEDGGACYAGWDESCQDNSTYVSPLRTTCNDHIATQCPMFRGVGFGEVEVFDLINNCPCACGIECGTWTMSPTQSPTPAPTISARPSTSLSPTTQPSASRSPSERPSSGGTESHAPSQHPSSAPTILADVTVDVYGDENFVLTLAEVDGWLLQDKDEFETILSDMVLQNLVLPSPRTKAESITIMVKEAKTQPSNLIITSYVQGGEFTVPAITHGVAASEFLPTTDDINDAVFMAFNSPDQVDMFVSRLHAELGDIFTPNFSSVNFSWGV